MLRVLSVCLSVVLVGCFLLNMVEFVAFLVGLLFSFVNDHLDAPVVMLSFPPSILALFAATFVIHVLAS